MRLALGVDVDEISLGLVSRSSTTAHGTFETCRRAVTCLFLAEERK
jgi:hypothetical protein